MYYAKCGNKNSEGTSYCTHCGNQIRKEFQKPYNSVFFAGLGEIFD